MLCFQVSLLFVNSKFSNSAEITSAGALEQKVKPGLLSEQGKSETHLLIWKNEIILDQIKGMSFP